eukprot:g20074.t1
MWWFAGVLVDDHKPRPCDRRVKAAGSNGAAGLGLGTGTGSGTGRTLSCWREMETERSKRSDHGTRCAWQDDLYTPAGWGLGETSAWAPRDGEQADGGGGGGCSERLSLTSCRGKVWQVFRSKKFESAKLERLYQRYFFRLNQSSLTMLMGVLVLVCAVMLAFHCATGPPDLPYVCVLSLAAALFLVLLLVCNQNGFHQDYMWLISYLVLGVLLCVQVLDSLTAPPSGASEGLCWTVFFVYIAYTLLPIRMRAAVISGITLSTIHTAISCKRNAQDHSFWRQ